MISSRKSCTRGTGRPSAASRSWPGRCGRSPWRTTSATGCVTRCTSARAWCPPRSPRSTTRRPGARSSARRSSGCRRPAGRSTGWPGTHVYIGTIDVDTQWQVQARAARFGQYVSPILRRLRLATGRCGRASCSAAYDHFDNLDLSAMRPAELWTSLEGRVRVPPAGLVHPLRGHVRADRELPGVLRAGRGDRAVRVGSLRSFLAGQQTFYSKTDEELWRLAGRARELEVDRGRCCTPRRLDMRAELSALPHGAGWLAEFDAFLAVYGQRTEETCRIDTPSWIEDPSPRAVRDRRVPVQAGRVRLLRRARSRDRRSATSRSRPRAARSTAPTSRGSTRRWPATRPPTSPGGTRSTTT